jgi:hypothetical protein
MPNFKKLKPEVTALSEATASTVRIPNTKNTKSKIKTTLRFNFLSSSADRSLEVIDVVARFIELFSRPAKGGATTKIYLFDFIKLIFGFSNSQNSS